MTITTAMQTKINFLTATKLNLWSKSSLVAIPISRPLPPSSALFDEDEKESNADLATCATNVLRTRGSVVDIYDVKCLRRNDERTAVPKQRFHGHKGVVTSLDSTRDNVVSGSKDGTICMWRTRDAKTLKRFLVSSPVRDICFNAEGTFVASVAATSNMNVWDVQSTRANRDCVRSLRRVTKSAPLSCAFSPRDPAILAEGSSNGDISFWDLRSAAEEHTIERAHGLRGTTALRFSSTGSVLVSGGAEGGIRIWDTRRAALPLASVEKAHKKSALVRKIKFCGACTDMFFSSSPSDPSVRVWSLDGHVRNVCTSTGGKEPILAFTVCADGRDSYAGCSDGSFVRLQLRVHL